MKFITTKLFFQYFYRFLSIGLLLTNIQPGEMKSRQSNQQLPIAKYKFIPPSKLLKTHQKQLNSISNNSNFLKSPHGHQSVSISVQYSPKHTEKGSEARKNVRIGIEDDSVKNGSQIDACNISDGFEQKYSGKSVQSESSSQYSQLVKNHSKSNHILKSNSRNRLSSAALKSSEKPNYENFIKKSNQVQQPNSKHFAQSQKYEQPALIINLKAKSNCADKLLVSKLQSYIVELKQKEQFCFQQISAYQAQSQELSHQNRHLKNELGSSNKKCEDLKKNLRREERKTMEKCQQNELIIDSLKKVICSQMVKIEELERECYEGSSLQNGSIVSSNPTISEDEEESMSSGNYGQESEIQQSGSEEELVDPQFMKVNRKRGVDERSFEKADFRKIASSMTPDFGACTPNDTIKEVIEEQQEEQEEQQDSRINATKCMQLAAAKNYHHHHQSQRNEQWMENRENIFIMDSQNGRQSSCRVTTEKPDDSKENNFQIEDLGMGKYRTILGAGRSLNLEEDLSQKPMAKKNRNYNEEGEELLREIDKYLAEWKNK